MVPYLYSKMPGRMMMYRFFRSSFHMAVKVLPTCYHNAQTTNRIADAENIQRFRRSQMLTFHPKLRTSSPTIPPTFSPIDRWSFLPTVGFPVVSDFVLRICFVHKRLLRFKREIRIIQSYMVFFFIAQQFQTAIKSVVFVHFANPFQTVRMLWISKKSILLIAIVELWGS